MRLLGKCPGCKNEDTIYQSLRETDNFVRRAEVNCQICGRFWGNWLYLAEEEEIKGNQLIPVEIERLRSGSGQEWGVQLAWPTTIGRIPFCGTIISVLNTALILFSRLSSEKKGLSYGTDSLRASLCARGGVEGHYRGSYIELLNGNHNLGLYVVRNKPWGEGIKQVLDFYQMMLRYLFEAGPEEVDDQHRRGEILRLPRDVKSIDRIERISRVMLSRVVDESFAEEVVESIMGLQPYPFSTPST